MAVVVQTYPVPTAGANSYGDVVGFKAYNATKGNPISSYTDPQIEAALVQATEYQDMRWKYVGTILSAEQSTVWPRQNVWNINGDLENGIPLAVVKANYEYALKHLQLLPGGLLPDPERDSTGRVVKSKSVEVGPVSERTDFVHGTRFEFPNYPLPDGILKARGLIANVRAGGGIRVGDLGRG